MLAMMPEFGNGSNLQVPTGKVVLVNTFIKKT